MTGMANLISNELDTNHDNEVSLDEFRHFYAAQTASGKSMDAKQHGAAVEPVMSSHVSAPGVMQSASQQLEITATVNTPDFKDAAIQDKSPSENETRSKSGPPQVGRDSQGQDKVQVHTTSSTPSSHPFMVNAADFKYISDAHDKQPQVGHHTMSWDEYT